LEAAGRYLRENLDFRLDAAALEGLRTYYQEAAALGLIAAPSEPRFFAADGAPARQPLE
jgi:hypothetical protein